MFAKKEIKKQNKKETTVLKEVSEEIQQIPETEENSAKELKHENVTQEPGKEVNVGAENKAESDEEELIQEEKPPETKAKDTAEIENKVKADENDGESSKEAAQEESQAEAPQIKNEAESEKNEP